MSDPRTSSLKSHEILAIFLINPANFNRCWDEFYLLSRIPYNSNLFTSLHRKESPGFLLGIKLQQICSTFHSILIQIFKILILYGTLNINEITRKYISVLLYRGIKIILKFFAIFSKKCFYKNNLNKVFCNLK